MSRGLHVDTLAVLSSGNLHPFHLLTFLFETPFRLTDHAHNISYNFGSGSEVFLSTGRLASTSSIEETLTISNPTIDITLTGANQADIALAFTENFNNRQVIIRRGFFDTSGQTTDSNIVASPFIIFDGRVESFEIVDNPSNGESAVTWRLTSHWADWEKISGRRCNNQDAKVYFPNEEGFSHVYDQIGARTWGRIRT